MVDKSKIKLRKHLNKIHVNEKVLIKSIHSSIVDFIFLHMGTYI